MKYLLLLFLPVKTFGFNLYYKVDYNIENQTEGRIYSQIVKNKPDINRKYAKNVAEIIEKYAKKYEIPADLIAAIAMKESGYRLNVIAGNDYGIMQVNEYNIKHFDLSKKRLLTDLDYSIKWGVHILNWFYETYGLKDGVIRYNTGTRPNANRWNVGLKYFKDVINYL